jgi:hypothetical protein
MTGVCLFVFVFVFAFWHWVEFWNSIGRGTWKVPRFSDGRMEGRREEGIGGWASCTMPSRNL